MPDAFDPYYHWLGIPPEEQPPDHYRLLGIKLFEENPDVIEAAGNRQMGHLRTYQSGQHSEASQKLLNEVAAAKVCLLKPQQKAAYDKKLKPRAAKRAAPKPERVIESVLPVAMPERPSGVVPDIDTSRVSRTSTRKKTPWQLPAVIATGAVVILGLVLLFAFRNDAPQVAHDGGENGQNAEAVPGPDEKPVRPESPPPVDPPPRSDTPPPPEDAADATAGDDEHDAADPPPVADSPDSADDSAAADPLGEVYRLTDHTAEVRDVNVSFDGLYLATAGADRLVLIVEVETLKVIRRLQDDVAGFTCVAITPEGKSVLAGCDEKQSDRENVFMWNLGSGELITIWHGRTMTTAIAVAADSRNVVTMHPRGVADLRRTATPQGCFPLVAHADDKMGWDAAISPDCQHLATVGGDGKSFVWFIGKNVRSISRMQVHQGEARSVAFSPDGRYILTGGSDRSLSLWANWKAEDNWRRVKSFTGHEDQVTCVAYSPDGKLIASGSLDKTVRIWNVADGKQVRVLAGHTAGVNAVAFLHDDRHVVSASSDHTVRIWQIAAGAARWPGKR